LAKLKTKTILIAAFFMTASISFFVSLVLYSKNRSKNNVKKQEYSKNKDNENNTITKKTFTKISSNQPKINSNKSKINSNQPHYQNQ